MFFPFSRTTAFLHIRVALGHNIGSEFTYLFSTGVLPEQFMKCFSAILAVGDSAMGKTIVSRPKDQAVDKELSAVMSQLYEPKRGKDDESVDVVNNRGEEANENTGATDTTAATGAKQLYRQRAATHVIRASSSNDKCNNEESGIG